MTNLDNQLSYDSMIEVLSEINANPTEDNIVEQLERLSSVERTYIGALMRLNTEWREAWVNEGEGEE